MEVWGTCHHHGCDEVLPWDMPAVAIDGKNVFCTPECAIEYHHSVENVNKLLAIHGPQGHADYERIDSSESWHSQDESVNILRTVTSYEETGTVLDELHEMMRGPYRVSFEDFEMKEDLDG